MARTRLRQSAHTIRHQSAVKLAAEAQFQGCPGGWIVHFQGNLQVGTGKGEALDPKAYRRLPVFTRRRRVAMTGKRGAEQEGPGQAIDVQVKSSLVVGALRQLEVVRVEAQLAS